MINLFLYIERTQKKLNNTLFNSLSALCLFILTETPIVLAPDKNLNKNQQELWKEIEDLIQNKSKILEIFPDKKKILNNWNQLSSEAQDDLIKKNVNFILKLIKKSKRINLEEQIINNKKLIFSAVENKVKVNNEKF